MTCPDCGGVVKKPKLDQHSGRCHGGFDCIDCSKTFNSPAEWKGHTSCVSEAEKYQKSLYKGPKVRPFYSSLSLSLVLTMDGLFGFSSTIKMDSTPTGITDTTATPGVDLVVEDEDEEVLEEVQLMVGTLDLR